jgi:two-component system sensor histidine kinase DesK
LAQASKEIERTRIARDLHDLLGHHLSALTINLQVASRLSHGDVKDKVEQCHALSKLFLNDVRDAVTTLCDAPAVGLRELLSLAISDISRLEVDQAVTVNDVKVAETVLRCVQESITNSLCHSKAKKLSIQINEIEGNLAMSIRDDGQGAQNL